MPYKLQKFARRLEQYCVVKNVFSEDEVDKIVDLEDLQKFSKGQIGSNVPGATKVDKKNRDSDVMWLFQDQNSDWLFQKFGSLVSQVNTEHFMYNIDGFENFQYTRYKKKEHYDWHIDIDVMSSNYVRKISASVMLTGPEDYEGGEFEIVVHGRVEDPQVIKPNRGDVIFFASWMPHRVRPVTSGVRKSLVCWVMGERTN